jgi:hypothetical protein
MEDIKIDVVFHTDGTIMPAEEVFNQMDETGRACPKCRHCGVDTMYLEDYDCEKHPEIEHVHSYDALQCEYYDPLSDEELEHRFNIEWPEYRARFNLSFFSDGTKQINDAIRALATAIIEKGYFTWQKLNEVYDTLGPRDYDDWPRKILAIAKLCDGIADDDLNRMTPEERSIAKQNEWACEICAYRYNCPLHPEECILDVERGCEYYLPDDEEIARLKDE